MRWTTIAILSVLILEPTVWAATEGTSPSAVRTLKEAYAASVLNSERIAISEQAVRQAEALYRQTLGSSLPELSYWHDTLWQDRTGTQNSGAFQLRKLNLTGYRELVALQAGDTTISQRKYERMRALQLLLQDVAGSFYGLLQAHENLTGTRHLIELAESRLAEVRSRVRIGRSRDTESIEQEYQITALQSQLEEISRSVGARADLLSFFAGRPVLEPVVDASMTGADVPSLERYLARVPSRPDVQAAKQSAQTSRYLVQITRSDYFPRLDLSANYYTDRQDTKDLIDWDASLGVTVPLWAWGARRASVSAARAVLNQSEQALRAVIRQGELEARNTYRDYISARKQLEFQQKAVELARRDYELQMRDDRRGLVTSLEVLEAMNRLNLSELALNNARLQARLADLNLEIASGAMPDEVLQ